MYAAAPGPKRLPPGRPVTGMSRKKLASQRADRMRLLAYQFGAYDNMEEASAFDMQIDAYAGIDEEMARELAPPKVPRARRIPLASWWLGDNGDDNGMSPESDYVGGAFTAEDVAADVQQDQFAALAPSSVVASAAKRAMRRRLRRGSRREQNAQLGIAPIIVGGAQIARGFIHGSSTGASNAATDAAAERVKAGDAAALAFVVKQGGFTSNGGWRGAVGKGADYHARDVLNDLINGNFVVGPLVDHNSWTTLPGGGKANDPRLWKIAPTVPPGAIAATIPQGPVSIIPTLPPGVTAPVPQGPVATMPPPAPGQSVIDQLKSLFSTPPAVATPTTVAVTLPAPGEVPTRTPTEAGLFGGGGDSTMKYLLLAGVGLFALSLVMPKR